MKNWKIWKVINEQTGEVLFEGRKRDAIKVWYPLWVYERKHYIGIYQTSKNLVV